MNIELGLTLLIDIAPEETAVAVSALLLGYRFPVLSLQNQENWRKVQIARFYLIRLKGQLWERSRWTFTKSLRTSFIRPRRGDI